MPLQQSKQTGASHVSNNKLFVEVVSMDICELNHLGVYEILPKHTQRKKNNSFQIVDRNEELSGSNGSDYEAH